MTHRRFTLGPTPAPPTRPLPDIPDEPMPMPMPGDPPAPPTEPVSQR